MSEIDPIAHLDFEPKCVACPAIATHYITTVVDRSGVYGTESLVYCYDHQQAAARRLSPIITQSIGALDRVKGECS